MKTQEIRQKYLEFFQKKDHYLVESASLVPADSGALFTSAGMQQFIPYLSGKSEPPYKRACSVQKCFRTSDIDVVGDAYHHTFFEMLGNWSFNDYFKREAIEWAIELLTSVFQLEKDKLWISVFKGIKDIPCDLEAIKEWERVGIPEQRIKKLGIKDNFWGPVAITGPCGPCSEIYYDLGKSAMKNKCTHPECGPGCDCGRFIEIWNLVFMEYMKDDNGNYQKLSVRNVDTGAGLERIAMVLQKKESDYETDLFFPLIQHIEEFTGRKYQNNIKSFRIIADHIRGAVFLIADKVLPSKEDRGYVLRRIIRRAVRYGRLLNPEQDLLISLAVIVIEQYKEIYPELELKQKGEQILNVLKEEEAKFFKTLRGGSKHLQKLVKETIKQNKKELDSKAVFHLYDTYGFPLELTQEIAEEGNLKVDKKKFQLQFEKHREISRAGVEKKFGGAGSLGEKVTCQHTATHLLHQALREVLGDHVQQAGSDMTLERLRFDFTHPQKLTDDEKQKIEKLVNQKIKEELEVEFEEMLFEKAVQSKALAFFKEKYPKIVKVYSIGDFSKEICAGPHVKNTKEIKGFKIIREKASGAGVRRIKAVVGEKIR